MLVGGSFLRDSRPIPAGSLPEPVGVLPELIVPCVEIEIELLFACGTDVPWFWARIPTLAELMITPGSVVMSRLPAVAIARIP